VVATFIFAGAQVEATFIFAGAQVEATFHCEQCGMNNFFKKNVSSKKEEKTKLEVAQETRSY
jgi:hypothetical protein